MSITQEDLHDRMRHDPLHFIISYVADPDEFLAEILAIVSRNWAAPDAGGADIRELVAQRIDTLAALLED